MLKVREERAPPNDELNALLLTLFQKVIPRLLRLLESNGRKVQPSLVHGDLWYGDTGVIDESTGEGIVYDPAGFWAPNECTFCSLTILFSSSHFSGSTRRAKTSLETGVR